MACVEDEGSISGMENLEIKSDKDKIHVMLLGAAGAGKSSLINSLIQINEFSDKSPKRKYQYVPTARSQFMGGHSMMREPVELTDTLTIVDNRGWHDWGNKEALIELTAQIHGERTYDEDVNWTDARENSSADKVRLSPFVVSDKIDCIAIVLNGEGGIGGIENLGTLIETCRKNTRRRPSFVITHKDKMSGEQIGHIKTSLEADHGIDPDKIFLIKNVTARNEILDAESKSCLSAFIKVCVEDGEAGAASHRRREKALLKEEELEMRRKEKEISDGKRELDLEELGVAKIRLDIETENKRQLAEKRLQMLESEGEYFDELRALRKEKIKKLNKLKLEQSEDMHKHTKDCIAKYFDNVARKVGDN